MVSFKETVPYLTSVRLYRHFMNNSQGTHTEVWNRVNDLESDFAHVLEAEELSVQVDRDSCINTNCFQLHVSFFPESRTPQKTVSGLWNCSVPHYPSFHHHLACNLEVECDNGQDETEHCPYSSSDCPGMVAMCNHCYKFVPSLNEVQNDSADGSHNSVLNLGRRATDHCGQLSGSWGQPGLPLCVHDWYGRLQNMAQKHLHPNRHINHWVGLYTHSSNRTVYDSRAVSAGNMYVHSVTDGGKGVIHHSVAVKNRTLYPSNRCLVTGYHTSQLDPQLCEQTPNILSLYGTVCEFRTNETIRRINTRHSRPKWSSLATVTNTDHWLNTVPFLTKCNSGQVTFQFIVCGNRYTHLCVPQMSICYVGPENPWTVIPPSVGRLVPAFVCSDDRTTLSYSLVCDFIEDCPDKSDESFCKHPVCINAFSCFNGQCISSDKVCDHVPQCRDGSDEWKCGTSTPVTVQHHFVPSPALVNFDGVLRFTSVPMEANESCPDSHYRCPGEFNDCLPIYTRCNGWLDCLNGLDEDQCDEFTCPGFFRCRFSSTCVHFDHLCDGWSHCPMHDDELSCDGPCPEGCLCQGHTFVCRQRFTALHFPHLRFLNANGSGMSLSDVTNNNYLIHLSLAHCSLTSLSETSLLNLKVLNLNGNYLQTVNMVTFVGFKNLKVLSLSMNPLQTLYTDFSNDVMQRELNVIDASFTKLTTFDFEALSAFPQVHRLNLTSTSIHTLKGSAFQFTPQLRDVYLGGSPVKTFPLNIFKGLLHLAEIITQNSKLCSKVVLPDYFDDSFCSAPAWEDDSDDMSSNGRGERTAMLLSSRTHRGYLWLIACLALTGNALCFYKSFRRRKHVTNGFTTFIINLNMADFLTGIYIVIVGAARELYRDTYLAAEGGWKSSAMCKAAGFLSLLSSEVSALVICFVTANRFVVLCFPRSAFRFERASAVVACLLIWLVGWLIALIPVLPVLQWDFYGQTDICTPLAVSNQDYEGRAYSFGVLIIFNFVLALIVSAQQACICCTVRNKLSNITPTLEALDTTVPRWSHDVVLARRVVGIALTESVCWCLVAVWGVLGWSGFPVAEKANEALAVFVYPLNSALNPFLYLVMTTRTDKKKGGSCGKGGTSRRLESRKGKIV